MEISISHYLLRDGVPGLQFQLQITFRLAWKIQWLVLAWLAYYLAFR